MKKKFILAAIGVIIVIFAIYQLFLKKEAPNFTIEEVSIGTVMQEVSETGMVEKGQDIDLSFQSGGKISKIYVNLGDEVERGDILAKIDTAQLNIQLTQSEALLDVAEAQLTSVKTSVSNYEIALAKAQQDLIDATLAAQNSLDSSYEDALNYLDDAYLKIYNASETVKNLQLAYFIISDQPSLAVKENKVVIETSLNNIKSALDTAKTDISNSNIDNALLVAKSALSQVSTSLGIIRQTCEDPVYINTVSSTYKTSLDTHRTNINTAMTNVANSQQAILTAKIANDTAINAAQSGVAAAEGNLKKAQEDINLYVAKISQSEADIKLLQQKIAEAVIYAPSAGQITDILKEAGEIVQASAPVFSFMSAGPFQVAADIYEGDIVKIKVGNEVDINLTAFPDQIFVGRVISIDPAEKMIDGVVYYEIKIAFDGVPENLKPGMTADITIKTARKENVLTVSGSSITKKDNKAFVQVVTGENTTQEREIVMGLEGDDNTIEVISGLQEGEQVAVPK